MRLEVLRQYDILDTPPQEAFDSIARLAAWIADTPVALVTLLDDQRQWFKANIGLNLSQTPLEWSFCARAIERPSEVMQVRDACQDVRFTDNPLVTGDPFLRFYAGAPLISAEGIPLGTLCVIDREPRELEPERLQALATLAQQVMVQLELRRTVERLHAARTHQHQALTRLQALGQVSQVLVSEPDLDRLLQTLVNTVASVLTANRVTLILFNSKEERVTHFVKGGPGAEQVLEVPYAELMEGLSGWALTQGQPAISPGGQPDPRETLEVQRRRAETNCGAIGVIPLLYQDQALGTLTAIRLPEEADFDQESVSLLEAMVAQMSAAVAKAQQGQALREREALYRGLVAALAEGVVVQNQAGQIVASNPAVEEILGLTPDQMMGRTSLDPLWRAVHEDGSPFPGEDHPAMVALRTGEPQREVVMGVHKPHGGLTWISVNAQPLLPEGEAQPQAVVASFFDISEARRNREALAQQVAQLLDKVAFDERLLQLGGMLQACLGTEEVYQVMAELGPGLFPQSIGGVYAHDPRDGLLNARVGWGEFVSEPFPAEACWGLRSGQPHHSRQGGLVCTHLIEPVDGALCLPLLAQGQALGLLSLHQELGKTSQELLRRARLVADTLALALTNLRLLEALREQAVRDPLTNLPNRRLLEARLSEEVSRSTRHHQPLSLLMMDVDDFKGYNDRFGHPAGDEVLRQIAALLVSALRGEDFAARYGGEEFAALLPDTPLEAAWRVAERIRTKVTQAHWPRRKITLSLGVAQLEPALGVNGLVSAADSALYRAKQGGRNRVEVAG